MRKHIPPGTAVAVLALVLAAGGTATAASLITGAQVKNGSLTGADVRNSSLSGADIRNHSVSTSDLTSATVRRLTPSSVGGSSVGATGPAGARGPTGPAGPAGPPGPAGGVAASAVALGPDVPEGESGSGDEVQASKADCPPGTIVTGGGWDAGVRDFIANSHQSGNSWFVISVNVGPLTSHVQAYATCASSSGARSARAAQAATGSLTAAESAEVAHVRAEVARTAGQ